MQETTEYAHLLYLHDVLVEWFDEDDLRDLCFRLPDAPAYEDLAGKTKPGKARELVLWFKRQGRLPELIELVKQLRPKITWPDNMTSGRPAQGISPVPPKERSESEPPPGSISDISVLDQGKIDNSTVNIQIGHSYGKPKD